MRRAALRTGTEVVKACTRNVKCQHQQHFVRRMSVLAACPVVDKPAVATARTHLTAVQYEDDYSPELTLLQFQANIPRFDPSIYKNLQVKLYKSPGMYAQRAGLLDHVGELVKAKGSRAGVVTGGFIDWNYGGRLDRSLLNAGITVTKILAGPEACWEEVHRVVTELEASGRGVDYIIGLGAGKLMDVARVTAHILGVPHILIPTLASTDAPGTALGVLYNADGSFKEYFHLPDSPAAVLMDSGIIAESPIRYTIAGLGDAMSTFYEARAVRKSGGINLAGGLPGQASWALASFCQQTLLESAATALEDIKLYKGKTVTPALDRIIEANSLLSGVGVATCGIACAHALHNGLTSIQEIHDHRLHGEIVGWTTIVQILLEGDRVEAEKIARWNHSIGLPVTFRDMNMSRDTLDKLPAAVEVACAPTDSMQQMPMHVSPRMVLNAMYAADELGCALTGQESLHDEACEIEFAFAG